MAAIASSAPMTSDGVVYQVIRRSNRNQMILCIVVALIVLVALLVNYRYLANFFLGPLKISESDIAKIQDVNQQLRYYVSTTGEEVIDTGWQTVRKNTDTGSKTVSASYGAIPIGDKFLLVKTTGDVQGKDFTGTLMEIPANIQTNVVGGIEQSEPSIKGAFLPFMLDTTDFRTNGYIGLAISAVLYAICLWGIMRVVRRSESPQNHPIMKSLGRYGDASLLASEIDQEYALPHYSTGNVHVTPNWLMQMTSASLKPIRLEDVAWAYKSVTQHRTNGIPTGKTYSVLIWDRYGVCTTLPGKEAVVDSTLQAIAGRVPFVVFGYSPEIMKMWKSDRQNFINAIDQRKQKVKSAQSN